MTHEYAHFIDLSMFSPSDGFPEPLDPAKSANRILAYCRELEERVAKMQAAGDVLTQISGILGLYWASEITPSMEQVQDAIEAWRNA